MYMCASTQMHQGELLCWTLVKNKVTAFLIYALYMQATNI